MRTSRQSSGRISLTQTGSRDNHAAPLRWFALIAGLCCAGPGTSLAACVEYGDYAHWVSSVRRSTAHDIAFSGTYAYFASGSFRVVDISTPDAPEIVASLNTPHSSRGVAISGQMAYVADRWSGLQVIDIADPHNPAIIGSADTPGSAEDVALVGDYAFVADAESGLQVIDVSQPQNPQIVGSEDTPGTALEVVIVGALAYVADGSSGLQVMDVSDPQNPQTVGSVDTPGLARELAVSGALACVADGGSGLQIIDISDPQNPQIVSTLGTPAVSVALSGVYAYVAAGTSGFEVIDVSDPQNPQIVLVIPLPRDEARNVEISGGLAFVTEESSNGKCLCPVTVHLFDVTTVQTLPVVGSVSIPGTPLDVALSGTHAYVASRLGGLQVVDVADPQSPQIVGVAATIGTITDVSLSGTHAYIVDGFGLRVIDIANPHNPQVVGSEDTPGGGFDVVTSGPYAYIADGPSGLQVVDVSVPNDPQTVGNVDTPGHANDLAISGTHVFLADGSSGLCVIDVSDPQNPQITGSMELPGAITRVALSGNRAVLTQLVPVAAPWMVGSQLQVIDVTDPSSPQVVGEAVTPAFASQVAFSGTHAYVANGSGGLQLIDLVQPTGPQTVGGTMQLWAEAVTASGEYVYLVGPEGLQVLAGHCPAILDVAPPREHATTMEVRIYPNPGSHDAVVRFRTNVAGSAVVGLFDVTGRMVREVFDGALEPGPHEFRWNGLDHTGQGIPAGVYFVRISTPEGTGTTRYVQLR